MNDDKRLPDNWIVSLLGEVCDKPEYGWTTSAAESGSIKFLRTTDISSGEISWNSVPFCKNNPPNVDQYLLRKNDIVISRAGSVGLSALIGECPLAIFASYLIRFRPSNILEPRYIYYFLNSPDYWKQISDKSAGIALQNVNARKLESISLPLAPFNEQRRIVAEIEKQFARLSEGIEVLRGIKEDLRLYRASVLKAACQGSLVTTEATLAHQQERDYEAASELLQKILKQRRAKWEREQLAKIKAQGKKPKDNKWKDKYIEPEEPNTGYYRPELPDGWTWAGFEQVASFDKNAIKAGPFGSKLKKTVYTSVGYKIYGQEQVIRGDPFYGDYYIDKELYHELSSCAVKPGDLLISLVGTTGKVLILPKGIEPGIINPRLLKFSLNPQVIDVHYAKFYLESPMVKGYLRLASHGGTMGILNLAILKDLSVPLPPLAEQKRIVAEVEKRLGMIEELETTVSLNLKRAEELRHSILQRAFAGRLVSQDPHDEPASVLLKRIAAAHRRKSEEPMKEKKRTPRRKEAAKAATKLPFLEEKDLLAVFNREDTRLSIEAAFESGGYDLPPTDGDEYEDVDTFFAQLSELLTQATLTIERERGQLFLRRVAR